MMVVKSPETKIREIVMTKAGVAVSTMDAIHGRPMGLGTCVIGSAVSGLNTPEIKVKLGIPVEVLPIAPIIVGVPSDKSATVSRKEPQILSWK